MKTIKRIGVLILLAAAPFVLSAADHIVFIHGWNGDKATWERMISLMTIDSNPFTHENFVPFYEKTKVLAVDYSKLTGGYGDKTIEEIAGEVNDQIKNWLDSSPDGTCPSKVDFVVHSMGGLVLRYMVASGLLSESLIDRVVTLGTPHYGQKWDVPNLGFRGAFGGWLGGSKETRAMLYASKFLWVLANAPQQISPGKILCIGGTKDRVVDEWSAALRDENCKFVRYVAKSHSTVGGDDDAIYFCKDNTSDTVYKLVTEFLSKGTASSAGSLVGSQNKGAILFQVVDGKGKPVAYQPNMYITDSGVEESASFVSRVKKATSDGWTMISAYSPSESFSSGIGAVVGKLGGFGGIDPDSYVLDIQESKDKIFTAFTSDPIQVKRGRTTVQTIYAESVKPLDYVFLIDTTGSMGSHINSVKSNAKNLIETQLLNGARDCRVAVVDYRDFPERTGDSGDYAYDVKCGFTSDAATALSAINSLSLGYGGDGPETVYSGIHACIVGKGSKIGGWRENSVKTIMVMGDARPLDPEPITGYTKSDVVRWANELKTAEDDEGVDIDLNLKSAGKKATKLTALASVSADEGGVFGGISIYPVVTSSSLTSYFSEIAEGTGGKVVSASSYASVADAVKEVIEQSVAANGFETEIVTVRETAGSVSVRVFGGSTSDAASIGYQVVAGSAVNGKDFTAAEGIQRLTWAEGERSYKTITIPVTEDASTSNDKFFSIILCDPSNMGLGSINVCRINLLDRNSDGVFRVGDVYVQGLSRNSEMGAVSGSGFCAAGASRTLTATATSGYVFTSWENGSMASRRSVSADDASSHAVDGVATYVASFISLADLPVPTIESSGVVTGIVGQDVSWGLDYYSMSEVTVTCAGLPPGLTFANGIVSGSVSQVGQWAVDFTVTNAKGSTSKTVEFAFVAQAEENAPAAIKPIRSLSSGNAVGFSAPTKPLTYRAFLSGGDGGLKGTATLKVGKGNPKNNTCAATVTIQPVGGKKKTIKGTISAVDGTGLGDLTGLIFTADGVTGTLNGYSVDGTQDASKSKDASTVAILNQFKGKAYVMAWEPETVSGANAAMVNGVAGFSVAFGAKGKAKVTGTLPDGTKVSVTSQLIVGEQWCCLPVIYAKKSSFAFVLWFDRNGNFDSMSGLTDWKGKGFQVVWRDTVAVSAVRNIAANASFQLLDAPNAIDGAEVVQALLPQKVPVEVVGTKWSIAKAEKVALDKSGNLAYGSNPAALKLSYTAKTGLFKGSCLFYTRTNGKLKKHKAAIHGVVVNSVGYGTVAIKKIGCWTIAIKGD